MKSYIRIISILILLLMASTGNILAHGGEDHGDGKPKATASASYFSSENKSELYEVLIKYGELVAGADNHLTFFLSDVNTNKPIADATITISSVEDENQKIEVIKKEPGIYELHTKFVKKQKYNLNVSINGNLGADLIQIADIGVGKKLPKPLEAKVDTKSTIFSIGNIISILIALFIGLMIGLFVKRNSKSGQKIIGIFLITILIFLPVSSINVYAHGDEDHGKSKNSSGLSGSTEIVVPKETQFLFDISTQKIGTGEFDPSINLFGTLTPTSSGKAVVQTPQTGIIKSLKVEVGQTVYRGQLLAIVEQNIDAGTQISLISQRSTLEAEKNSLVSELKAAKKEYDRLNAIADIAAKRDIDESEKRYNVAVKNLELFEKTTKSIESNNSKIIYLNSPINGKIDNFNFSIGSTVNAGQDVFNISNLSKLYVEAQVFDKDVMAVKNGKEFMVECTDNHKTQKVKLLTMAQSINTTNQSQKVLFEMDNEKNDFKIGEFVNIRVFSQSKTTSISIPNSAITEINGKSAVFIKDAAERFTMSYVALGENNGQFTTILKGIEEGERVVINGTYQLKMMYLNQ